MDIGSLRLNDLTYLASSVSAYLLASICTDVCTYTHIHYSLFLLLVLIISPFDFVFFPILILFEPGGIRDFMTHCPLYVCDVTVTSHGHASVHSVFKDMFMNKGCPSVQSARYVEALSFQRKTWQEAGSMMMV